MDRERTCAQPWNILYCVIRGQEKLYLSLFLSYVASMDNHRVILTVISLLMIGIPLVADTNQPTTDRVITADFHQVQGPLNTMFKKCVGAGRANEGLAPTGSGNWLTRIASAVFSTSACTVYSVTTWAYSV